MNLSLVNINFESQLRDKNIRKEWCWYSKEIEYLFFYLKQGQFLSHANYEQYFLDLFPHIQIVNRIGENHKLFHLWGTFDLENEKKRLSSKVQSHQLLNNTINRYFSNFKFEFTDKPQSYNQERYIFRSEYGFSGVPEKSGKFVITKKLKRIYDLSLCWRGHERGIYENYVSKENHYFGTKINKDLNEVSIEDYLSRYEISDNEVRKFSHLITDIENEILVPFIKNDQSLTMDFFIYKDSRNSHRIYPFCEFNTRMSMGVLAHDLFQCLNFKGKDYSTFYFLPKNEKNENKIKHNLSPCENKFMAGFS